MQWSRSSGAVVVVPSPLHGRSLPSFSAPFFATRLGLFQKCPFLSSYLPSLALSYFSLGPK